MDKMYRLIIFDMDGTLLKERTIFRIAKEKGFLEKLISIMEEKIKPYEKTILIAKLLKCMDIEELIKIFRKIPLNEGAEFVIKKLKEKGIKIAIATDSYQIFALDLKKRLGIDFIFSNELVVKDGHVTGEIKICNNEPKFINCKQHSICKKEILNELCKKLGIRKEETIAVGDGEIDICMIKEAGLGIAFNGNEKVIKNADVKIENLAEILKYVVD